LISSAGRQFSRDAAAAVLAFWLPFIVPEASETASVFSPWGHILGEAEYSESYGKEREIRARALLQYIRGLGFWKGDEDGFRSTAAMH
jgi:hypothetical protein